MNVLVLGSGGREHAIALMISHSKKCDTIYVAPGNGGTASFAKNIDNIDPENPAHVAEFAQAHNIGLVVIGPEAPLVTDVTSAVRAVGIPCFGPGADGAKIEGSKEFAKIIMDKYDLPTAEYEAFSNEEKAAEYVRKQGAPIVIKADGLAAGKGVTVASTTEEALSAVHECFDGRFGKAGARVVIEECMTGPECSMLAIVSGKEVRCLETSQDHKRAFDGDRGPNTGGMGAYSPVPFVTSKQHAQMQDIMKRAAAGIAAEGIDYRGCLYGGFMLTDEGPKLLEFNARFGDPETQVVLPRLKTDLLELMLAAAEGKLDNINLQWDNRAALGVIIASEGYPGSYESSKEITGAETAELDSDGDVIVFHAGTKREDNKLLTSGGRVLCVSALGETFQDARDAAYEAAEKITFDGAHKRNDIGYQALSYQS